MTTKAVPIFGGNGATALLDTAMFPDGEIPKTTREQVFWAVSEHSYVPIDQIKDALPHANPGTVAATVSALVTAHLFEARAKGVGKTKEYRRKLKTYVSAKMGKQPDIGGDAPPLTPPVKLVTDTAPESDTTAPPDTTDTPIHPLEELRLMNDRMFIQLGVQRRVIDDIQSQMGLVGVEQNELKELRAFKARIEEMLGVGDE